MRKTIILLYFFVSFSSFADEYYDFQLLQCSEKYDFFHMRNVGIWNIGKTIWPASPPLSLETDEMKALRLSFPKACEADCSEKQLQDRIIREELSKKYHYLMKKEQWFKHEKAMINIERDYNLYSYGKLFGRYNPEPFECKIGSYSLTINSKVFTRLYKHEGDPEVKLQGHPLVIIRNNKNEIELKKYFQFGDVLTASLNNDNEITIDYCHKKDGCGVLYEYTEDEHGDFPSYIKYRLDFRPKAHNKSLKQDK